MQKDEGPSMRAANDNLATPLRLVDGGKVWIWVMGLLCLCNARSQKDGRERPGALLARRTRTMKLCSSYTRRKGQPRPLRYRKIRRIGGPS